MVKLWKIKNYLPNKNTPHPGRPESSLALLWEPKITWWYIMSCCPNLIPYIHICIIYMSKTTF
jgi:hypothetical protein